MTKDEKLTADEIYNERAGICEYSGLLTREEAEALGMLESKAWIYACLLKTINEMTESKRIEYYRHVTSSRGEELARKIKHDVGMYWIATKTKPRKVA